jgi:hypothetical protein
MVNSCLKTWPSRNILTGFARRFWGVRFAEDSSEELNEIPPVFVE